MSNNEQQRGMTAEQERRERDSIVASRVDALWSLAIHWPAKYRRAIEACLDTEADFDRAAIRRSAD